MKDYLYVDNSNLLIEGKRLSAAVRDAMDRSSKVRIGAALDSDFKIDYRALYSFLADSSSIPARAVLFGSQGEHSDSVWSCAREAGFETKIAQRTPGRGEKGVDTALVSAMLVDVLSGARDASAVTVTLVAGDADFVPALEKLNEAGCRTEVAFWTHATAESLHAVCHKFIPLDSYITILRWVPLCATR
jgi:uncharacterized LabA/DUF88 family protein